MSTDAHVLAERQVPRYTSYPTAPHFTSDIGPGTYAAWLAQIPQTEPLSIYFHVPFCKDLCLYCGCHTKAIRKRGPLDAYIDTLKTEIGLVADCTGARQVSQVHWGGGTPSILGGDGLSDVVSSLAARFDLRGIKEHAIELDPRHVEPPLAHALAGIGVNRASTACRVRASRMCAAAPCSRSRCIPNESRCSDTPTCPGSDRSSA